MFVKEKLLNWIKNCLFGKEALQSAVCKEVFQNQNAIHNIDWLTQEDIWEINFLKTYGLIVIYITELKFSFII